MNYAYCWEFDRIDDLISTVSQECVLQTRHSVSLLKTSRNTGIRRRQLVAASTILSGPPINPKENKRAYLVANAFLGSVATQLRWGEELYMRLWQEYHDIVCQKYEHWFKLLSVTGKKNPADIFETHGIWKLFSMTLLPLIITAFWWKDFFFLVFYQCTRWQCSTVEISVFHQYGKVIKIFWLLS